MQNPQTYFIWFIVTYIFSIVFKESCRFTNILAATCPEQFYFQASSLVKPLLMSMTHQHSKVRVSGIQVLKYMNYLLLKFLVHKVLFSIVIIVTLPFFLYVLFIYFFFNFIGLRLSSR